MRTVRTAALVIVILSLLVLIPAVSAGGDHKGGHHGDHPTEEPLCQDTPTPEPTEEPTPVCTDEPTAVPTEPPTEEPTEVPTEHKVWICHVPPGNPDNPQAINVDANGWNGHNNHDGDFEISGPDDPRCQPPPPTETPTEEPTEVPTETPTETPVPTEEPTPPPPPEVPVEEEEVVVEILPTPVPTEVVAAAVADSGECVYERILLDRFEDGQWEIDYHSFDDATLLSDYVRTLTENFEEDHRNPTQRCDVWAAQVDTDEGTEVRIYNFNSVLVNTIGGIGENFGQPELNTLNNDLIVVDLDTNRMSITNAQGTEWVETEAFGINPNALGPFTAYTDAKDGRISVMNRSGKVIVHTDIIGQRIEWDPKGDGWLFRNNNGLFFFDFESEELYEIKGSHAYAANDPDDSGRIALLDTNEAEIVYNVNDLSDNFVLQDGELNFGSDWEDSDRVSPDWNSFINFVARHSTQSPDLYQPLYWEVESGDDWGQIILEVAYREYGMDYVKLWGDNGIVAAWRAHMGTNNLPILHTGTVEVPQFLVDYLATMAG